jgi:hypothetical protein
MQDQWVTAETHWSYPKKKMLSPAMQFIAIKSDRFSNRCATLYVESWGMMGFDCGCVPLVQTVVRLEVE